MVTMHIAVVCVGLRGLIVVVRRIGALSRGGGFSVAVLATTLPRAFTDIPW